MKKSFSYKKILVIGCPGGGKSTFSRRLAERTGLPLFHLDNIYWKPDRTTVEREVFDARLCAIMTGDAWIIDGNYGRTQPLRMDAAEAVFFFDMPVEVCLAGAHARRGTIRSDIPWTERADAPLDEEFLASIRTFHGTPRETILARLAERPHLSVITFRSHAEAEAYLAELTP